MAGTQHAPERRFRLSPATYRRITFAALLSLSAIVITGASVRLTGSGLGCTDWPTCEQGQLAPADITHAPAMIEFVNRLFTGVVSVAVILAVLGSLRRVPLRRDLTRLSLGLVAGVLAQIVLGALVVLLRLSPTLVMGHFLLSMVIIANAVVLHHRAGHDGPVAPIARPATRLLAGLVVTAGAVVLFTGTVVTASGPHAGDDQAERLAFAVRDVARIHGVTVVILVTLTLLTLAALRRERAPAGAQRAGWIVFGLLVAQAGVGYTQYFTGVPALLVGVHVLGALCAWIAIVRLPLALTAPAVPVPAPAPAPSASPVPVAAP